METILTLRRLRRALLTAFVARTAAASLTEFNALQHAFTRLNRSLPAHAQLGNSLVAKKQCSVVRRLSESVDPILDVKLFTLATIREVLSEYEAHEVRLNIKLDKPQGRAFVAKQLGKPDQPTSPPPRGPNNCGDPVRRTPNAKSKAPSGPWTSRYVKCSRHCGGSHWQRDDCPKRRKAKLDKGPSAKGRAAIAASDAAADEKLDAAIGNVLLAADSQPHLMEIGAALCVRSNADT
eukprot:3562642-Pleurochrysis_carterae.AAC.1